jgi:flagellar protein FliO/FliZ
MDIVNIARFLLSFVVVIGLLGGLAWVLRRYGTGRITTAGGKGRLGVVEVSIVDAKRRLVLIKRDDVEHLLLLSPTSEMIVETGINSNAEANRFADRLEAAKTATDPANRSEPSR